MKIEIDERFCLCVVASALTSGRAIRTLAESPPSNRTEVRLKPRRHIRPAQIVLALLALFATVAFTDGMRLRLGSGEITYAPADSGTGGAPGVLESRLLLAEEFEDDQGEDDPPIFSALASCECRGAETAAGSIDLRAPPRHRVAANFPTGPPVL